MSWKRNCICDFDPAHHADINKRRGLSERGSACTNFVDTDSIYGRDGFCVSCMFVCAP